MNFVLPSKFVFGMLAQINILVFLAVRIAVIEQGDGPQAGKTQHPEDQQDQLHDQV